MVDSPPDRPWPRKSNDTTPPASRSLLATFQTAPCCQDRVKPWATTNPTSLGPGRCTASMGTPSSVTRVSAFTTGPVMLPFCAIAAGLPYASTWPGR